MEHLVFALEFLVLHLSLVIWTHPSVWYEKAKCNMLHAEMVTDLTSTNTEASFSSVSLSLMFV